MFIFAIHLGLVWNLTTGRKRTLVGVYFGFGAAASQGPQQGLRKNSCLGLVHWDDPEGWNGEGGGRRVQDGKESACNKGDLGSIPGSGRSAGEGKGYALQYSWTSLVGQLLNINW